MQIKIFQESNVFSGEQQQRQQPRIFDQAQSKCAGMKYAGMDKSFPPIYVYITIDAICNLIYTPIRE